MNSQPLHIARSGQPLGVFGPDQVRDGLENGQLLRSDHYYDERRTEWVPLAAWRPPPEALEFRRAEHRTDRPLPVEAGQPESTPNGGHGSRSGRGRSSRSKKDKGRRAGLGGWIACLFALGLCAGLWAWAESIRGELRGSEEKLKELNTLYDAVKREKRLLSDLTPPGRIRAVIVTMPGNAGAAVMSGATVALFKRADIIHTLASISTQTTDITQVSSREEFAQTSVAFKRSLPAPLDVTLADSAGSVEIPIPEDGDYVLFASAQRGGSDATDRYFWLVGFEAGRFPSRTILLTESNAITIGQPQFVITDIDTMSAGGKKN